MDDIHPFEFSSDVLTEQIGQAGWWSAVMQHLCDGEIFEAKHVAIMRLDAAIERVVGQLAHACKDPGVFPTLNQIQRHCDTATINCCHGLAKQRKLIPTEGLDYESGVVIEEFLQVFE